MKQANKKILTLSLVAVLVLTGLFAMDDTYSYWTSSVRDGHGQAYTKVTVGRWRIDDTITPPPFPPPQGSKVIPSTHGNLQFSIGDIVYHKGDLILIKGNGISEKNLLSDTPTYNTKYLGWRWFPNRIYHEHSVVYYNGKLYVASAGTGNVVGQGNSPDTAQFWSPVGHIQWLPGKSYRQKTKGNEPIVEYQGELYKAKWHITGSQTPPPLVEAFERIRNPLFQPGNLYPAGSVVRYQGGVYRAVKSTDIPPRTSIGHWVCLDSAQWSPYQEYRLHDVVTYQGKIFLALDGPLATKNAPHSVPYAWKQIDTYQYNAKNLYGLDDVVVENGTMYRSLQNNNKSPLDDAVAWVSYPTPGGTQKKQTLGISLGASGLEAFL